MRQVGHLLELMVYSLMMASVKGRNIQLVIKKRKGNCIRQHQQNAQYYIKLTIKILQLLRVSILYGSSSGNAHQFYV